MSRAATGVKMQSNGQGTFGGSVKWSSDVLDPISGINIARRPRGVACACAVSRWSTGQGQKFAVVKRSRPFLDGQKILTPVAALDTAPMGVTPPPLVEYVGDKIVQ